MDSYTHVSAQSQNDNQIWIFNLQVQNRETLIADVRIEPMTLLLVTSSSNQMCQLLSNKCRGRGQTPRFKL